MQLRKSVLGQSLVAHKALSKMAVFCFYFLHIIYPAAISSLFTSIFIVFPYAYIIYIGDMHSIHTDK